MSRYVPDVAEELTAVLEVLDEVVHGTVRDPDSPEVSTALWQVQELVGLLVGEVAGLHRVISHYQSATELNRAKVNAVIAEILA